MRKPDTVEKFYLNFDGFFASVMQQAMPPAKKANCEKLRLRKRLCKGLS